MPGKDSNSQGHSSRPLRKELRYILQRFRAGPVPRIQQHKNAVSEDGLYTRDRQFGASERGFKVRRSQSEKKSPGMGVKGIHRQLGGALLGIGQRRQHDESNAGNKVGAQHLRNRLAVMEGPENR